MANIATATKKAEVQNSVQGAWITFHQVSADPTSIAAGARGAFDIGVAGVKTGDLVFISVEGPLTAELSVAGAKVTATDVITFYLSNNIDATTAIDQAAVNFNFMVLHLT